MKRLSSYTFILGVFFINGCGGRSIESTYISPYSPPYSPSPDPLPVNLKRSSVASQALEQVYALCEKNGHNETDPFCLSHNLRNIRQIIKPYLHKIKDYYSPELVRYTVNEILAQDLKISHFYLDKNNSKDSFDLPFGYSFAVNNPSKSFIERNYVELKLTDFKNNFNIHEVTRGVTHALAYQKGIIIDLRENSGGYVINLNDLFSYFFPPNTIISHRITRKHEPFLGGLENWIGDYSKYKMKNLVHTIESNWQLTNNIWEKVDFNLYIPFQKNIAILINENSASCSEHFTMALKEHFPTRVKVIGKKSAGALLTSLKKSIPHLGLDIYYPIAEIIGIHGTRVEGIGIEPDERVYDEAQTTSAAIKWVTC